MRSLLFLLGALIGAPALAQGPPLNWERFNAQMAQDRAAFRKEMKRAWVIDAPTPAGQAHPRDRTGQALPRRPKAESVASRMARHKRFMQGACPSFATVYDRWLCGGPEADVDRATAAQPPKEAGRGWGARDARWRISYYAMECRHYAPQAMAGLACKRETAADRRKAQAARKAQALRKLAAKCDDGRSATHCMDLSRRLQADRAWGPAAAAARLACHYGSTRETLHPGCAQFQMMEGKVKQAESIRRNHAKDQARGLAAERAAAQKRAADLSAGRFGAPDARPRGPKVSTAKQAELRRQCAGKLPKRRKKDSEWLRKWKAKNLKKERAKGAYRACATLARLQMGQGNYIGAQRFARKACVLYMKTPGARAGHPPCDLALSLGPVPKFAWRAWAPRRVYDTWDNPKWTRRFCEAGHPKACRLLADKAARRRAAPTGRRIDTPFPADVARWAHRACVLAIELKVDVADHCMYARHVQRGRGKAWAREALDAILVCRKRDECGAVAAALAPR